MKRPWAAAAATAALTSLLFVVVYNVCNQLTHVRPDVDVWAFSWERYWPLVPAMIIPYWSIDLLFVIAPFLCATREEVAIHRRRVFFVILGGAIGFLLIPLRFAFPRPHVTGSLGAMFAALYTFDFPHNLFPSLHIALRTILTNVYLRKSRGVWIWIVHGWFSLVGLSTLLTWQHHIVDVFGGFWLAAIALHLFRFRAPLPLPARNRTVAVLYAIVAIVCSQLARLSWPWTFIFTWPMFALGTAAYGYAGYGSIYRKQDGRLTRTTRILFAPLLAGQWLSWRHYRRQASAWTEVTPHVWLGALLTEKEARTAVQSGVTAVLDLTVEFSEAEAFRGTRYLSLPVLDLTAPSQDQLSEAVAFIERQSQQGIVYVHCKAGYSRSAAAIAAWLIASHRDTSPDDAFEQLRRLRPSIVIRPEIHTAIHEFHSKLS
jgi:protein-tyrosine phosphatase/membrane-associated phospholipid phosphatase